MHNRKKYPISIIIGVPIFLYLDSPYFEKYFSHAQLLATVLVIIAFYKSYLHNSKRVRFIMIAGVFVGFAGEIFFSLFMGMYHYRLGNIPLWVGFGHSLIFSSVYQLVRTPFIINNKIIIKKILIYFSIAYSLFWFYQDNDLFGLLTTVGFLILIFVAKKSQLFFLVMYLIVVYIEQVGTSTLTWYWPSTVMGSFSTIPSGNPPSGIAIFYFLFDYIVLYLYLNTNKKLKNRWEAKNNLI